MHCCYIVRQLLKSSSKQYRNSITDKNGPGGSGTHDLSQLFLRLLYLLYLNGQQLWKENCTVQIPPAPLFFFTACSPKPCTIKQICKKASQGSKKLRRKVCAGLGRLTEGKMEKWKKPAHTADCSNHVWM